MSRTVLFTVGFLLIFAGIQLNVVQSFTMTPRVANFVSNSFAGNPNGINVPGQIPTPQFDANLQNYNSPYYQASYANNSAQYQPSRILSVGDRTIYPPRWICWPVLFFGAVMILQGLLRH